MMVKWNRFDFISSIEWNQIQWRKKWKINQFNKEIRTARVKNILKLFDYSTHAEKKEAGKNVILWIHSFDSTVILKIFSIVLFNLFLQFSHSSFKWNDKNYNKSLRSIHVLVFIHTFKFSFIFTSVLNDIVIRLIALFIF